MRPSPGVRRMSPRRVHALSALALVAAAVGVTACVVETEPAPPRPLLRDVLRAHPPPAPATSAADASTHAPLPPEPPPPPDAFRACEVDTDCVAVLRNGCCHDGRNEALNKTLADAYTSSFVCPIARPVCPTQLVLDRRVATCDTTAHLCKLVDPPP